MSEVVNKVKPKPKLCIIALKYAPFVAGVLMWLHVILRICGINLLIAENLVGLPIIPCTVCCLWSYTFGFCWLHRAFIAYTSLVTYCINLNADIWYFGSLLTPVRWFLFLLGTSLIIIFFIRQYKYKYKLCHEEIADNQGLTCQNCGRHRRRQF